MKVSRNPLRSWLGSKGSSLALALAVALLPEPIAAQTEPLRIETKDGALIGARRSDGGRLFAGIPYAAPPVGSLRWKAPEAPQSWTGTRDARQFGATCPQADLGWNKWDAARTSEDCLTLNVSIPPGQAHGLPVMVWFHGGGFVGGSGNTPTYEGSALTRNGVILVTVNYRLGVLGFLAHPELSAKTKDGVSGNYGLQDQIAALAWVNRNIAKFGGNPANVTISGQSAGSMSVANLITIPAARSHFNRAILQSGTPFGIGALPTLAEAELANAGFGTLAQLRSLAPMDLIDRWTAYAAAQPASRRAIPIVDGRTLRRQPTAAFLANAARDLPLLLGSNVREIPPAGREALLETAKQHLDDRAATVLEAYETRGTDPLAGDPGTQMMTDMMFRCGTIATAATAKRAWLYHFMEPFPGRADPAHSGEVFYVFDTARPSETGEPSTNVEQARLGAQIRIYWTNFAKRGDPNGAGVPIWPAYSLSSGSYIELAAGGSKAERWLRREQCAPFVASWRGH